MRATNTVEGLQLLPTGAIKGKSKASLLCFLEGNKEFGNFRGGAKEAMGKGEKGGSVEQLQGRRKGSGVGG